MRVAADGRVQRALGVVLGTGSARPPFDLNPQTLKTAFRRQAHRVHPDKALSVGLSEQAMAARFRELKHAYDYLLALLEAQKAAGGATPRPGNGRPAPRPAGNADVTPAGVGHGRQTRAQTAFPWSGKIPARHLRFAQYLYYAGVIDWSLLFRAMRWQHRTRPSLGEIAREIGILSADDVRHVLRHKRTNERFGEAALRLGRLDHVRLLTILGHQHRLDRPIGRYFVEQGILTLLELDHWLRRHWTHNLSVAATEMRSRGGREHDRHKGARQVPVR
jgi:hypothetical protein